MIDPNHYGVSFSIKQCAGLHIDPQATLDWLIESAGFRRFRIMSYWNEHEKQQGIHDFSSLDAQIDRIERARGQVSLCLGVRQPRWPESHWPAWALALPQAERYHALEEFITIVVQRYKNRTCVVSYQLENEALNRGFGRDGDFNRARLRKEFKLVKQLDPDRPIIMSTSNSWGLPFRRPIPDRIGFSVYRVMHMNGRYRFSKQPIWTYTLRAALAKLLLRRPSFIHELQAEPWGPKAIWEMSKEEQAKSMSMTQLSSNLQDTTKTRLYPIDLWGGEWWYWRYTQGESEIIDTVIQLTG